MDLRNVPVSFGALVECPLPVERDVQGLQQNALALPLDLNFQVVRNKRDRVMEGLDDAVALVRPDLRRLLIGKDADDGQHVLFEKEASLLRRPKVRVSRIQRVHSFLPDDW
jgi:hypothetical protein